MYVAVKRIRMGGGKFIEAGDTIDESNWAARSLRYHIRTNRIARITGTLEEFKKELRKTVRGFAKDEVKKPSLSDSVDEPKAVAAKAPEKTSGKKKKPQAAKK